MGVVWNNLHHAAAIMTAENGGRDGNVSTCRSHVDETVLTALQGTTIALALLILIILGFTFKRKRLLQRFFWGLPGIVPVNLLTYSPSRLVLVLIFGVMSGDILYFINHEKDFIIYSNVNCYSESFLYSVLTPLLLISYLSLKFFPLFACVGVTVPILGPSLGLLYSIVLFSYNAYYDFKTICLENVTNSSDLLGVDLASRAHIYGASLIIVLWFLWDLVRSFVLVCTKGFCAAMLMKCKTASGYYYYTNYVRHLLRRKPGVYRNYTVCKVLACVMPFWFSPRKLPLKFVAAMTVTFSMIYQFSLYFFGAFLTLQLKLITYLKSDKQKIIEWIASNFQLNGKPIYETLLDIAQGLGVVLPVSPIVAMVFCFILLFHLIITVYKNIADSARGKFKFISLQPTLQLSYSWRYPGYQIAFAFTALVFYTFVLWMLGIFGLGMYFAFKHYLSQSLCALTVIIFPVAWLIIGLLIQVILAKVAFIKERAGKFIVLNNIRVFHWVSYFLFIYDAIGGLFAAILRTLFSLLFILVLMLRLDKVVFMKGFQWFDIGHKAYMGFLHLNHTHNNPVVHAFILLLSESSTHHHSFYSTPKPTSKLLDYQDSDAFGEGKFAVTGGKKYGLTANGGSVQMGVIRTRSIQIRNRWLVAYTLIRNPSLQRPPAPADHTPMPLSAPRPTTSELKWQGQTQE